MNEFVLLPVPIHENGRMNDKHVASDQTPRSFASDLGLHCLQACVWIYSVNVVLPFPIFLWSDLTLTTLWANSTDDKLMIFFSYFPRKQAFAFHANCLLRRQDAWNTKAYFLGKNKKTVSVCCLLKSLPSMQSVNMAWINAILMRISIIQKLPLGEGEKLTAKVWHFQQRSLL